MASYRGTYTAKQKKIRLILTLAALAIFLLVELIGRIPGIPFNGWSDIYAALGLAPSPVTAEGEMEVHFIDVGNADCILVRQEDKNLLIDAGERGDGDEILDYLNSHGITALDLVVATHPHADHIGAMADVIDALPVGKFLMSFMPESETPTTATYLDMLEVLDRKEIVVEEAVPGTVYELGTARLQILAPFEESKDANDISVVTRLTFGDRAFVFTGDAGTKVEKQMLSSGYTLTADVLKLGHHGSNTSNSKAFIQRVDPAYAVITCGEGNSYGHPHQEPIDRLLELDIPFYRADVYGHIVFTTDGKELTLSTQKGGTTYE